MGLVIVKTSGWRFSGVEIGLGAANAHLSQYRRNIRKFTKIMIKEYFDENLVLIKKHSQMGYEGNPLQIKKIIAHDFYFNISKNTERDRA